jgi:hypothetical protein
MPILALILPAVVSACYSLDAVPHGNFTLSGNTCFAFHLSALHSAGFSDKNLTIRLSVEASNTFLGLTANASLPSSILLEHAPLPSSATIDSAAFTAPIPVLCSPDVDGEDAMRLVFPTDVATEDGLDVAFGVSVEENSSAYFREFRAPGNCLQVLRRIPKLDVEGVTVGECVGMVLGLVLGALLIAGCIVFLIPHQKGEKGGGGHVRNHASDDEGSD